MPKSKIKFGDVRVTELGKKHIQDCLDSNYLTMGPKTAQLEKEWAQLFGYNGVVCTGNGTAALIAACLTLYERGAKPGDEIICPALSFIATANAIRAAGFVPRFVDVRIEDMLIDETLIESAMTAKTVALMPVMLMGKPPRMDVIRQIADKHKIIVIADNCEAHGCEWQGSYMSRWAELTCYSMYAAHLVFGVEGGCVGANSEDFVNLLRSVRSHGRAPNSLYFSHQRFGLNLKPTDIHSSIALGSIKEFWQTFNKRKANQLALRTALDSLSDRFYFVEQTTNETTSPHAFSMTAKRDAKVDVNGLYVHLENNGIEVKRNFGSMPDHGCFSYLGHKQGEFINASWIGNNGLHFACHQYLSLEDLNYMAKTVLEFFH